MRSRELITLWKRKRVLEKYILGDDIPLPDGSEDYSKFLKNRYKNR